ncbi:MAG: DNA repair protein RadA [Pseudomonadota bacterium]
MAKPKTKFLCSQCGANFPKWSGRCSECQAWNCIVEEKITLDNNRNSSFAGEASTNAVAISEVELAEVVRFDVGNTELNRVLGGGVVPGSAILIGGDPGIGKSTLLLQTLCHLSEIHDVLYITGEESLAQIKIRAQRLGLENKRIKLLAQTQIENILEIAKQELPQIIVIDSIQTICTENLSSAAGSVSQVRESAAILVQFAKRTQTTVFIVGHVTKEGHLAGPRILEHMVDTVLYFEGDSGSRFRLLRAIKNRFGAVNEIGIFAMQEDGLKAVTNPSAIFLSKQPQAMPGSVVMVTWEGTRPMCVELQALVDQSHLANPRRVTLGFDSNRLSMLLAVLHRHAGIVTYDQDVFINIVGGMRIQETALDLAIILAVYSSLKNKIIPRNWIVFGEIGLSGELRPIPNGQERLREAQKHGFTQAIIPKANQANAALDKLAVKACSHIREALEFCG